MDVLRNLNKAFDQCRDSLARDSVLSDSFWNSLYVDFGPLTEQASTAHINDQSYDGWSAGASDALVDFTNTKSDHTKRFARIVHKTPGRLPDLIIAPSLSEFLPDSTGMLASLSSPMLGRSTASFILPATRYTPRRPKLLTTANVPTTSNEPLSAAAHMLKMASSLLDTLVRMNRSPAPADPTTTGALWGDEEVQITESSVTVEVVGAPKRSGPWSSEDTDNDPRLDLIEVSPVSAPVSSLFGHATGSPSGGSQGGLGSAQELDVLTKTQWERQLMQTQLVSSR